MIIGKLMKKITAQRSAFPNAALLLLLAGIGPVHAVPPSTLYDISTFASLPAEPGFPEGVAIHGNLVFVSGPARFGTAGTGPSAIQIFDRNTAELTQTIEVSGENTDFEHALSNIAIDQEGRIYALSTQLGLIRFEKQAGQYVQQAYGDPLPDLPCTSQTNASCPPSDSGIVIPPLPNDIVFDAEGFAYVSDSLQSTIFRYAPGGGAPTVWFQSSSLEGGGPIPFGANGIRIDPAREYLYVAVTASAANPNNGIIYRLPLGGDPTQADLEQVHVYDANELPDQLAFGANGKLYVSLALSNQISVLDNDGTELTRFDSSDDDDIPLDNPAGIAFDSSRKSLLIANHALLSGNPAHFAVLKAFVNDPGNPLEKPDLP
jgi:sugar lactone lactonase YvrE